MRLSRLAARFVFALGLLLLPLGHAFATDKRIALIIGNADYQNAPHLDNSVNDARAVRDALNRIGFEVYFGSNLSRIQTEELLKRFYRAADGARISLFYYAGHGVQLAGANYLVPVDADLTAVSDIQLQAMNIDDIFQYLRMHTSAQLIFLDACRSNPAAGKKYWVVDSLRTADQNEGLARSAPSVGSLIAYATAPGQVAFDGTGPNSPYTSAFIQHVATPNQEIREMLTGVRRDVIAATGGRQVPWETSSLVEDVYLVRAPAPPLAASLTQVTVASGGEPEALNIPLPRAGSDAPLKIAIDRLPNQGRLLVDGKPVTGTMQLKADEFRTLAYDPSGLQPGAMNLMSYVASDPYGQSSRGVVAINVVASTGQVRSVAAEASQAHDEALEEARRYMSELNRVERGAVVGIGPEPIGLPFAPTKAAELDVSLARAPDNGLLRLGDRVLTPGVRVALADLHGLAFEPKVGSDAQPAGAFALALVGDPSVKAAVSV